MQKNESTIVMATPFISFKENFSAVPSKNQIESFFNPSHFNQVEMELNTNEEHVDD